MTQTITSTEPEGNKRQDELRDFIVTANPRAPKCGIDHSLEVNPSKVAIEQLKTGKTGQLLISKLNLQISIDSVVDFAIS